MNEEVLKTDDGIIAMTILIAVAVAVVIFGLYYWRSKRSGDISPPPERAEYLEAKSKLSSNNPEDADKLKKLLMRRTLKTIPFVLQLQSEGSSIERLYKKGMLTDNMHFKVKELKSFIDEEFQEIQFEAESLVQGWGQIIWPQAMQFHQMILKQTEDKSDDQKLGDEEKKKVDNKKKKDRKGDKEKETKAQTE